ncbi:hypothetical protein [Geobacter sp. SVR]|uniref:hypothetical protein n=1 Tax=Geobacter sp. SVR TaxID=2495594 RepID=UPI00143EFF4C|nr:hypothetical protein [Geobacter sp. SVR]BCS55175.1 hypothetical protein GSVR_34830 [Geobacter sp. SVR]GCF85356.1 hypothetical protein GSbR_19560 [Geobacter sp. SVR]
MTLKDFMETIQGKLDNKELHGDEMLYVEGFGGLVWSVVDVGAFSRDVVLIEIDDEG